MIELPIKLSEKVLNQYGFTEQEKEGDYTYYIHSYFTAFFKLQVFTTEKGMRARLCFKAGDIIASPCLNGTVGHLYELQNLFFYLTGYILVDVVLQEEKIREWLKS